MKARYVTFYSYIGTGFRSSEKLWMKNQRQYPDPESVQGIAEIALLKLKSLIYPHFVLSSRTDGGVHALNTSAHFDLEKYGSNIYHPDAITFQMNKFFYKNNISIYIKKCLRVADDFDARRWALARKYLYRFAVLKKDLPEHQHMSTVIPIEEWKRCHFMRLPNFDIERFKEGAKYFPGYHDFSTFKKFDKLNQHKHNRRLLYSFDVRPGTSRRVAQCGGEEHFDYWEVEIRGRAFVHNQIRRMIGTLMSVGIGKIPPEEVKVMLQVPSKHSWHTFTQNCPPDGLYLCDVEYNPEDLIYKTKLEGATNLQSDIESDSE
ncbi:tRNA pseudouridine synthase-like 1 isoform X2 [Plodia interpunctella]|uniref:tRNA pseudouridine synthase-like 1 isoform X2 n=2 Tax=Plodia interpunctella TaxID=58824 RepID=UPI002368B36D|nr:tRNA pseudouridine synthase-like 1 isoform X2 [Plodia interpunctella]